MSSADYVSVWSHAPSAQQLGVLDNPELHGTPVQDFLSGVSSGGWQAGFYTAPPCHDLDACNALSHYPLWQEVWQEVLEVDELPEGFVEVAVFGASPGESTAASPGVSGEQKAPEPLNPELVAVKLKPCSEYLTPEQLGQLTALCREYAHVFSVNEEVGEFPASLVPPLTIDIVPGAIPCRQHPYSTSKFEEDWLREQVGKMASVGLVRRSTKGQWVSPIVIVRSGGKLRLCVNYQKLNAATVPDAHPMPRVDQVVSRMSGCRYITHMDVRRGFWHLPIAEEDCHKTAFATPWGEVWEFTRCPFGLVHAPAAYQRAMDTAMSGVSGCSVYMDDTYVYSKTWEEHLASLRGVFQRCSQYNIKLNWEKCGFAAPEVKCLGYVVGVNGLKVDDEKVAAITQLPRPRNAKGVKNFLGMAGYFRQFIEHFAELSAPLVYLTRKQVPFKWCDKCEEAFVAIKAALVAAPCLRLPDWDRPFLLHVDWSKVAVGCYLSQEDDGGAEFPVAFASRLLTPAEQRYAPLEGECLALVWATHKFRYYLFGREFTVFTDHRSLEWLQQTRFNNPKVERWALRLQEFRFRIVYKEGEKNVVADCLSRACAAQLQGFPVSVAPGLLKVGAAWPEFASSGKQAELDAVACSVCDHPGGADNMVVCEKCEQCYHLRCLIPPMTTVPSGDWFCPACDPLFNNGLLELFRADTPLSYAAGDPYTRPELLSFLQTGEFPITPEGADPACVARIRAGLRNAAVSFRLHPALEGWLLVRRGGQQGATWLCCPPLQYRWDIMRLYHDALGHCGARQLVLVLHRAFHWRGLKYDAERFVKVCDACQRRRLALPELPQLQPPVVHAGPFKHVHIDLAGPFPTPMVSVYGQIRRALPGEEGQKGYVVLMVDYFTKAAEFTVVHSKHAAQVAAAVYNTWVCRYGVPEFVTTDNGGEFEAEFTHMLQRLGVEHWHTSANHPASNGAVERLVQSFKGIMARLVNDHPEHWVKMVPQVRMAYMSRVHAAVGVTPFEMLHGVQPRLATSAQVPGAVEPAAVVPLSEQEYVSYLQRLLQGLHGRALQGIREQFARNQEHWQRRRSDFTRKGDHNIQVGHLVLVLDERPDTALSSRVHGPYRVVKLIKDGAVAVLESGNTALKPQKVQFTKWVGNLARYYDERAVFGQ